MTPHHSDVGGKVGTALASIGSFVAGYVQSDLIFNELVRLFSSCMIAALGAAIGYYVTRWLKSMDSRWDQIQPPVNPGAHPSKMSARIKKTTTRRNFAKRKPSDEK
jgi:hypothetical protein